MVTHFFSLTRGVLPISLLLDNPLYSKLQTHEYPELVMIKTNLQHKSYTYIVHGPSENRPSEALSMLITAQAYDQTMQNPDKGLHHNQKQCVELNA